MLQGPAFNVATDLKKIAAYDARALDLMTQNNRLLLLALVSQNPLPGGRFLQTITGAAIGSTSKYIELCKNDTPRPVGIAVHAYFATDGHQIKLSLTENTSDDGVVDYLGRTAGAPSYNARISKTIVLKPNERIYINTADTGFVLDANDRFTPRMFDAADYLADIYWQTR